MIEKLKQLLESGEYFVEVKLSKIEVQQLVREFEKSKQGDIT